MASGLLAPPGGELCSLFLREEERSREVGCQWESPDERREVGCQSEEAERRDAAVQVDLLNQPGLLLQCFTVRADGEEGGALLQHCTPHRPDSTPRSSTRRTLTTPRSSTRRTRSRRHTAWSGSHPKTQRKSGTDEPSAPPGASPPPPVSHTENKQSPLGTTRLPHIPLHRLSLHPPHLPLGRVEEERSDPTWTPPDGDPDSLQSPSVHPDIDHSTAATETPESSVCDVCGKVMKCRSSLARHSFTHTGEKPYSCPLCSLRFNRRDNLQHHLDRLHPHGVARVERQRPYNRTWLCHVCGKTFSCRSRLKTHEVIHTGVKPHPCDLCPKAYMRTNDLERHRQIIHTEGAAGLAEPSSLLCDLCGREFRCRSQLASHFQTHTGERPHLCDLCGRKFARPYQLKRHRLLMHTPGVRGGETPQEDRPFVCSVCGKRLKSDVLLAAHSRTHTGDQPHRCGLCPRGFQRAARLKQHQILVHFKLKSEEAPQALFHRKDQAPPKVFVCQDCGRAFKFKSLLDSHALTHTGARPHACEYCERRFRRLSHLKRHREVVHANGAKMAESFVCHVCGQDKKCKSNLERHAIIHTGERPHACQLCPAAFNRHGNLQQHLKRVHGVGAEPDGEAPPSLFDEEEDGPTSVSVLSHKQEDSLGSLDSEPAAGLDSVASTEIH